MAGGRGQRAGRRAPTHAPARVAVSPRQRGSVGHGCRAPCGHCKARLSGGMALQWGASGIEFQSDRTGNAHEKYDVAPSYYVLAYLSPRCYVSVM